MYKSGIYKSGMYKSGMYKFGPNYVVVTSIFSK